MEKCFLRKDCLLRVISWRKILISIILGSAILRGLHCITSVAVNDIVSNRYDIYFIKSS